MAPKDSLQENLEKAKQNSKVYIDEHLAVAKKYQKPLVMEEFGYPRDNFQFSKSSSVKARDAYYKYIFDLVLDNASSHTLFAGCNFWGWGALLILLRNMNIGNQETIILAILLRSSRG